MKILIPIIILFLISGACPARVYKANGEYFRGVTHIETDLTSYVRVYRAVGKWELYRVLSLKDFKGTSVVTLQDTAHVWPAFQVIFKGDERKLIVGDCVYGRVKR